ncbi:hypothetical protein PABG_05313 [Paracoccidioides brasiliensis Pb03]|nr:hypothetical protein PABG_05313 [Paracoccidioides brasiliensis Pb03]
MADTTNFERLYCYMCESTWTREAGTPLQCPICESDFVEILEANDPLPDPASAIEASTFYRHRPDHTSALGPGETTYHRYRSGDGSFTFTRTTFNSSGSAVRGNPTEHQMPIGDPFAILRNTTALLQALSSYRPNRERRSPRPRSSHSPVPMTADDPVNTGLDITGEDNVYRIRWNLAPRDANNPQTDVDPFAHLEDVLGQFTRERGRIQNVGPTDEVAIMRSFMSTLLESIDLGTGGFNENRDQPATPHQLGLLGTPTLKKFLEEKGELDRYDGKASCAICMEHVELDCIITQLPCDHWFHTYCISRWLDEHNTCPHCRRRLTPQDSEQQRPQQSQPGSRSGSGTSSPASGIGIPHTPQDREAEVPAEHNRLHLRIVAVAAYDLVNPRDSFGRLGMRDQVTPALVDFCGIGLVTVRIKNDGDSSGLDRTLARYVLKCKDQWTVITKVPIVTVFDFQLVSHHFPLLSLKIDHYVSRHPSPPPLSTRLPSTNPIKLCHRYGDGFTANLVALLFQTTASQ